MYFFDFRKVREGISSIIKDLFVREDTDRKELIRRCIIAAVWFFLSVFLGKLRNIDVRIFNGLFIFVRVAIRFVGTYISH